MDRDKIIKMVVILAAVVIIATALSRFLRRGSMSLTEYARLMGTESSSSADGESDASLNGSRTPYPDTDTGEAAGPADPAAEQTVGSANTDERRDNVSPTPGGGQDNISQSPDDGQLSASASPESDGKLPSSSARPGTASPFPDSGSGNAPASQLTGASLNGDSQLEQRIQLEEGFYYEPLSDSLRRYITGVSFPAADQEGGNATEITFDELRYVHILHYDFDGGIAEGELICNEYIAQDLTEIFHELYQNEYRLEKVLLIDTYDGDDNASMEDNNTSCFNYRPVSGSTQLSRHALGLAVDINPLYNPYITYTDTGEAAVLPASASAYADRTASFPYKIDENDLCCKLFLQHGFIWGGNWNNVKDYQHFQKAK